VGGGGRFQEENVRYKGASGSVGKKKKRGSQRKGGRGAKQGKKNLHEQTERKKECWLGKTLEIKMGKKTGRWKGKGKGTPGREDEARQELSRGGDKIGPRKWGQNLRETKTNIQGGEEGRAKEGSGKKHCKMFDWLEHAKGLSAKRKKREGKKKDGSKKASASTGGGCHLFRKGNSATGQVSARCLECGNIFKKGGWGGNDGGGTGGAWGETAKRGAFFRGIVRKIRGLRGFLEPLKKKNSDELPKIRPRKKKKGGGGGRVMPGKLNGRHDSAQKETGAGKDPKDTGG